MNVLSPEQCRLVREQHTDLIWDAIHHPEVTGYIRDVMDRGLINEYDRLLTVLARNKAKKRKPRCCQC